MRKKKNIIKVNVPSWDEPPFTSEQMQTLTYIVPVKDIRTLNITFGVPDLSSEYRNVLSKYFLLSFDSLLVLLTLWS